MTDDLTMPRSGEPHPLMPNWIRYDGGWWRKNPDALVGFGPPGRMMDRFNGRAPTDGEELRAVAWRLAEIDAGATAYSFPVVLRDGEP